MYGWFGRTLGFAFVRLVWADARLCFFTAGLGGRSALLFYGWLVWADVRLCFCTAGLGGRFVVKGKAAAVKLFENYASDAEDLRIAKDSSRERMSELLASYTERNLEQAATIAGELRDSCPDDGPANWWLLRLIQERRRRDVDDEGPSSEHGVVLLDGK